MDEEKNNAAAGGTRRWTDVPFAIAFYIHFALFLLAATYSVLKGYYSVKEEALGVLRQIYVGVVARQTSVAVVTSLLLTMLLHVGIGLDATFMLHFVSVLAIVTLSAVSAALWWWYGFSALLLKLVFTFLSLLCLSTYLSHLRGIRVSGQLLRLVNIGSRRYPSLVGALAISTLIAHLYAIIANLTIRGVRVFFQENVLVVVTIPWLVFLVALYWAFSIYLTSQVILNTFRTVVAGVFIQDYHRQPDDPIPAPVFRLLRSSLSTQIGSIVYGSTLVMPISYVRSLYGKVTGFFRITGDPTIQVGQRTLDFAARRFNYFAFNEVAEGGKPYREAAPQTWDSVMNSEARRILDDLYVGDFSLTSSLFIGVMAATADTGARVLIEGYEVGACTGSFLGSLVLGMVIPELYLRIMDAGTVALMVCLAQDPASLEPCNPNLYGIIAEQYPEALPTKGAVNGQPMD